MVNTISRGLRAGTVWVNCCESPTLVLKRRLMSLFNIQPSPACCFSRCHHDDLLACFEKHLLHASACLYVWLKCVQFPMQTICTMPQCHLVDTR